MTTHRFVASQTIDRPIEEVFAFFSRPDNLGRITPPAMGFEQISTELVMRAGLEIEHRIRPLLGVPLRWRSRIESYDPPRSFVDVQVRGPYRRWEHHHTFTPVPGGTRIDDQVEYELPLGPLGGIAHRLEGARGPLPDSIQVGHADVTSGEGLPQAVRGLDALVSALAFENSPIEAPRRGRTFMNVDAGGTEQLVA